MKRLLLAPQHASVTCPAFMAPPLSWVSCKGHYTIRAITDASEVRSLSQKNTLLSPLETKGGHDAGSSSLCAELHDCTLLCRNAGRTAVPCPACMHACILSFNAFQFADEVHCSRQSMAALQPALSWEFLHHVNKSPFYWGQTVGLP